MVDRKVRPTLPATRRALTYRSLRPVSPSIHPARRTQNTLTCREQIVYRRYASLFFVCEVCASDNELLVLELLHRFVEVLDQYFGNVRLFFSFSLSKSMIPFS